MPTWRFAAALLLGLAFATHSSAAERRIALVIGNANYQAGALPTSANDAGLVAQTLQAAGFDVTGARDLDQETLRRTFHEFLDKASAAGPDSVAFVYLSGYGLQLEGENYFAPVDANIARDVNVTAEALRLSDYIAPLAALKLKASMVVLDLARTNPFAKNGTPLTGGLALVEPEPGMLIAFNAAPGTVAPDEAGPYSAYGQALAEMMREAGVPADDMFRRIRLRVNETTKGAEVPWNSAKLQESYYFFERAPDAPPPQISPEQTSAIRSKPMRDFSAQEAYLAAVDRDTLADYEAFLDAYPNDPMARRVRAIVAARREAITWRRTRSVNTPPAYWSYLERYPRGAHADDARRRLAYLSAAFEPPPRFSVIDYDVPPPPPDEFVYVDRPVLAFDDPDFDFAPPPPPPVIFLPPRPVYFVDLPPPPPPVYAFVLPCPDYAPVPAWVRPPRNVVPPPNNIIYNNIHNSIAVNNTTNVVTITSPGGQAQTIAPTPPPAAPPPAAAAAPGPGAPATATPPSGAGAGAAAAITAPLPAALATRAAVTPSPPSHPLKPLIRVQAPPAQGRSPPPGSPPGTPPAPGAAPTAIRPPGAPAAATPNAAGPNPPGPPPGSALPGANGQPLPPLPGAPPPANAARPGGSALPGASGQPAPPPAGTPPAAPSGGKSSQPPGPASAPTASPAAHPPAPPPPATHPTPPPSPRPAPPPPAARPAPPPQPVLRHPPPPTAVTRPAPPPPAMARPAPPPPPPRPAPPPPRPAPPPPPPPMARPAPPPPAAARPAPPAAKPCRLLNGQPCPPGR